MRAEEIKTGWKIVSIILACIVGVQLLSLLLSTLLTGTIGGMTLLRTLITGLLCWGVYQGNGVSRILLAISLVFNGGLITLLSLAMMAAGMELAIVAAFVGIVMIGFAVALFAVPQVNRYFEYVNS